MHILHLTPNFYPAVGGIETYVLQLAKRAVKAGHNVSVVTSNKLRSGKMLKEFEKLGKIKIYRVPFKLIGRYNFSLEALKMLSDLDYDVLHVHSIGYFTDLIPVIKKMKNIKIVVSTHGGIFHTKHMNFIKTLYFRFLTKRALRYSDHVIATSFKDHKLFSKICDRRKMSSIPPGVEWKKLSSLKRLEAKNTLLYVGRFSENKRLDRIVKVAANLRGRIGDVRLMLVGEDWGEKDRLVKMIKKLGVGGSVNFFSGVKDHFTFYRRANVFLLSSEYEGFGTSVVEAMSMGLPVVVNDIETMHEIVDRRSGYIVDFEDTKKVSKLVESILKSPSLQMHLGANARNSAKKFDWDEIYKKVEKIYRK